MVTLAWQLEDLARDDLSPLSGTLVFAEVRHKAAEPFVISTWFLEVNSVNTSL